MKRIVSFVCFLFSLSFCLTSFAYIPDNYTIAFSGIECVEDPDTPYTDYHGYGIQNESSSSAYVFCPINYLSILRVDSQQSYDPGVDATSVTIWVHDGHSSDEVECTIYGGSATEEETYYWGYNTDPYSGSGDAFTGNTTITLDVDAAISGYYDDFLFIHCRIPPTPVGPQPHYSNIMGYKLTIDPP